MITKWKVYNFKSVRKETDLEFAPLTIFAGANSSGKSTFLQSILLIAQTLAYKVGSRPVVLNGALARLGQFDDLRTTDSHADQIVIAWTCQPSQDPRARSSAIFRNSPVFFGRGRQSLTSVSCEVAFDTGGSDAQRELAQIQPHLFSTQLSVITRESDGGDRRYFMTVRRASTTSNTSKSRWLEATNSEDSSARTSLQYDVELDDDSLSDVREELVSAQPVGCVLRHFLPDRLSLGVDMVAEDIRSILSVLIGEGSRMMTRRYYLDREIAVPDPIVNFILNLAGSKSDESWKSLSELIRNKLTLFEGSSTSLETIQDSLRRISPRLRMELRRSIAESEGLEPLVNDCIRKERGEEPAIVPLRPPGAIAEATGYLDYFFSSGVRYLGPLRDEPKSLYPLAPTADPSDVGLKGEHTAAVLDLHKNRSVLYIPSSAFVAGEARGTPVRRTLETAVVDWLHYLGVAESIQSRDKGKLGHELVVGISGSGRRHDLTHVGVGVSQVLPILVTSLLAEPDTTLIFEQPELHLHPKVQTLLADFFLSMTQLGKQCIVETHSEYLINRLRFRVAAAANPNPWVSAIKIYFVEKPSEGSTFREVKVNDYGAVIDWPDGFFDQSPREAEEILKAAMRKRQDQYKINRTKKGTKNE